MAIFGLQTRREVQRAIEEAVKAAVKAAEAKWPRWLLETADAERYSLPDASVYETQADMYRIMSAVMTAVDITAATAALQPFSVSRRKPNEELEDIPNHPFELLLDRPNELDSRFEFLYATVALWMLNGNAYWWLNRRSENDEPSEMWIIPPHMIEPVPDGKLFISGYEYSPDGGGANTIFFEPYEIVAFRRFNPFSRFRGLSALETLALTIRGDIAMREYNNSFFSDKGGSPPGILMFENMIEDGQWEKIKEDKRRATRNREDMMLRGVGQGGVKWQQAAVSQKDMEFLAGMKFNRSEVFTVLAPGLEAKLDPSATEANANAGDRTFRAETVWPKLELMAQKITSSVLPVYGDGLIGAFDDVRITDRQLELQERTADERIMTIGELRRTYKGLDPLGDERDDLLVSQVTAPRQEQPKPSADEEIVKTVPGGDIVADTEKDEADNNALKMELSRWLRKAIKKVGRAVPFESDVIPPATRFAIADALPACKTESDVRNAFSKHTAEAGRKTPQTELGRLVDALNHVAVKLPAG